MSLETLVNQSIENNEIPPKVASIFLSLYQNYKKSLESEAIPFETQEKLFANMFQMIKQECAHPFQFPPYHKAITSPLNYYQFGLDFFRSLVIKERSKIYHLDNVKKMVEQIQKGENVVLLANHQSEGDPQIINLVLEDYYPEFAKELIFVAGDRVITDPLAIPFSKGTNLLCIYSKRHIDHPPEKKTAKQLHNRKTMHLLKELFKVGGKCIYVAPSGGRDRPNSFGIVEVAPFDPQSIEMFRLMAREAKTQTHFYTLALSTYNILPPPPSIISELGEKREPKREGVLLYFGNELDFAEFSEKNLEDRHERRKACADYIWNIVKRDYAFLKT